MYHVAFGTLLGALIAAVLMFPDGRVCVQLQEPVRVQEPFVNESKAGVQAMRAFLLKKHAANNI